MKLPGPLANQPPARRLAILSLLCTGLFAPLLWNLLRFGWGSELYSYLLLVPVVCVYLFVTEKAPLPPAPPAWAAAAALLVVDLLLLGAWAFLGCDDRQTQLSLGTGAFVTSLWIASLLSLGRTGCRARLFPLGFLLFLVPMPLGMEMFLETLLQHGSAEVADALFHLSGLTFFRDDLSFQLPGIRLMIAPECSGIHSSLVLFIVSLVAGYLFLRSPWKRALLTGFVLPLALLRNGFRVWVLGELCVQIDPSMIDSPIHHRGGPLFFALSLIPFLALLYWLVKLEKKSDKSSGPAESTR